MMNGAWVEQLRLEWRLQRRRPFVWFCALAFFAIAFGDTIQIGLSGEGYEWINGPSMIGTRSIIL
ncbi:MAG: hypothetical protein AAFS10_15960, partial [Myxococcota bacterium]